MNLQARSLQNANTYPYCSTPAQENHGEALSFVASHDSASTTPAAAERHRKHSPTTTHTVMFSPFADLYPLPLPSAVSPFTSYLGGETELSGDNGSRPTPWTACKARCRVRSTQARSTACTSRRRAWSKLGTDSC